MATNSRSSADVKNTYQDSNVRKWIQVKKKGRKLWERKAHKTLPFMPKALRWYNERQISAVLNLAAICVMQWTFPTLMAETQIKSLKKWRTDMEFWRTLQHRFQCEEMSHDVHGLLAILFMWWTSMWVGALRTIRIDSGELTALYWLVIAPTCSDCHVACASRCFVVAVMLHCTRKWWWLHIVSRYISPNPTWQLII